MKYQILFLVFIFFALVMNIDAQLTVKDQDPLRHILFQINDEGLGGSVTIPSLKAITDPTGKLYNLKGNLYWNGNALGLGSSNVDQIDDLSDAKYDGSSLFLGEGAGTNDNATDNQNTALGTNALFFNSSGQSNSAFGNNSLYSNTTGYYNTAAGYQALYSNIDGSYNTASGYQALYSNIDGSYNTASGYQALYSNISGNNNIAFGLNALKGNTTGFENTALGVAALVYNTEGKYNVAIGNTALNRNLLGDKNTAIGRSAINWNTSGENNTACGFYSLYLNETGNTNTANGAYALYQNKTGSYNTAVGYSSDVTSDNLSNTTALGYDAHVDASDHVRIGNDNVSKIGGAVTWSTYSDGRYKSNVAENIPGLNFVLGLRPITYNLNTEALANRKKNKTIIDESGNQVSIGNTAPEMESRQRKATIKYSGFIAQEVETLSKKINYDFSGIHVPENEDGTYSLSYAEFVVPLVKAVQEQQEIIESLTKRIAELEKGVN